jgi:hypothetical protein
MTYTELAAQLDRADAERDVLKGFWKTVLPKLPVPTDEQFAFWLSMYGFTTAHYAVRETGLKNARMGFSMTAEHSLRFASRVMTDRMKAQPVAQ